MGPSITSKEMLIKSTGDHELVPTLKANDLNPALVWVLSPFAEAHIGAQLPDLAPTWLLLDLGFWVVFFRFCEDLGDSSLVFLECGARGTAGT